MFKKLTRVLSLVLVLAMMVSTLSILTSCDWFKEPDTGYTYNSYLAVSPSNWNELNYQDSNDTYVMNYIGSSFFEFNFDFDANGEIIEGSYKVDYSAATDLKDVTAKYAEAWDLDATKTGYAYEITLRKDLVWDNGDPIKAEDFVWTMKEQLNPDYLHYRADSYYAGSLNLVGAKGYAKQGQSGWFNATDIVGYTTSSFDGLYFDAENVKALNYIFGTTDMTKLSDYKAYFQVGDVNVYDKLVEYAGDKRTPMTQEISDMLASLFGENGRLGSYWGWADEEIPYFSVTEYTYPEVSWDDVGIFVGDTEYKIVVVLESPLYFLNSDGSLNYKAAYNFSSLPLVHKATYEACRVAPTEGSTIWTTTYNTTLENTRSWGPYKLTVFQSGKEFQLERNENWYGYGLAQYEGQYQTEKIHYEIISEWSTAWVKFLAGEIDGIGLDVSVAADYKNSDRTIFTADDYVGSLHIQSDYEGLKSRQTEGVNKTILSYSDFRKALSLSIDRSDFTQKNTSASFSGYGLFNSMHYYDVANAGVYRDTDAAKKTLCETYGVDWTKYNTLDDAVNAVTGYNLELARTCLENAYQQALKDGEISATDKVVLTIGTSVTSESTTRIKNYLESAWQELAKGTSLEGRISLEEEEHGSAWANDFREGGYDLCMGGWSGAAWDPGYFLLAYLSDEYMYSAAWDTSSAMMKYTMHVSENSEDDITETMSLMDWYNCLNGDSDAKYDWSEGVIKSKYRCELIAALEKEILSVYYTVPLYNYFSASILSYKMDYITTTYNTFMGYGGLRYATYNYNNNEWQKMVKKAGGELKYK